MAGDGEESGHERLLHLAHFRAVVLQERLVPDAPVAVEVLVAAEAGVFVIVLPAVILLEADFVGKGKEAHRPAVGTMEEGRLVAPLAEQTRQTGIVVHGCRREDEGLAEAWYAAENGRHAVNAFPSVAVREAIDEAFVDEPVYVRCVSLVFAAEEIAVEAADVFSSEALDNQDHDVLLVRKAYSGSRGWSLVLHPVDRIVDFTCSLQGGEVFGNDKVRLAYRADKGKGGVEYQGAVCRPFHVLVGVADGDRAHSRLQTAPATGHCQDGSDRQAHKQLRRIGRPLAQAFIAVVVSTWHYI